MNSSFSSIVPNLQIAWDSTSLSALKTCARKYYYSIVCGYQPRATSVHLAFGIHMHVAKETYDRQRALGASHDDAVVAATFRALCDTWNNELNRPWASDDPNKNRNTLIRTIVWYFEDYREDAIETVIFANGQPAVELSFSFETTYKTQDDEILLLCGHMDRLGRLGDKTYVCDVKTTKHTVDARFFEQFSPHNQFTVYTLAAQIAYGVEVAGLIVDGIQVAVTKSVTGRAPVYRTKDQLDEWYSDLGMWLAHAERYAREDHWPMNEASCGNFGGCEFRRVCARSPAIREKWLASDYVRRVWDPLRVRGDI